MNTTGQSAGVTWGSVMRTIPMMLLSLVAIGGNVLVLVSVARTKYLHRIPGNLFVVNLAVTDVLAGLISMPVSYITVLFNGRWMFGSALCSAGGFLAVFLSLVTLLTLAGFSLYRFHTITSQRRRPNSELWRIVKLCVVAAWFAGTVLSFPPLVGWGEFTFMPDFITCTVEWGSSTSYSITLVLVGYLIPQSLIMSSYFKIVRFLKAHNKRMTEASKKRRLNNGRPQDDLRRATSELHSHGNESAVSAGISKDMVSDNIFRDVPTTASVIIYVKAISPPKPQGDLHTSELSVPITNLSPATRARLHGTGAVSTASSVSSFGPENCDGQQPPRKDWAPVSVKVSHNSLRRVREHRSSNASKRFVRQTKLTRVLITTVVAFQICWLPFAVETVLSAFGCTGARAPHFELVAVWLAYSNAICNPLIYALLNAQFRKAFRDTLVTLCKCW